MELTQARERDGGLVFAVDGELDLSNCGELRTLLVDAIEARAQRVTTLDLGRCTFIDSTALAVIVEAGERSYTAVRRFTTGRRFARAGEIKLRRC